MIVYTASVFILAFALSLDSFGVGMTYGLRRLRISWLPVVIIACCSGIVLFVSMQIGTLIMQVFSADVTRWIGALLLIGIGCWVLIQFFRASEPKNDSDLTSGAFESSKLDVSNERVQLSSWSESNTATGAGEAPTTVLRLQVKRLGIIIHILRSPAAADMDRSGTISPTEAAWLGVALSLDAFGAGIGAAMLGYPAVMTSLLIALFGGVFLKLGIHAGAACSRWNWIRKLTFLPGLMLITMGIMKLM